MTTIYNYEQNTGMFLSSSEAIEDPLNPGEFIIPANATLIAPPVPGSRQTAVWVEDSWVLQPDWRNVPLYFLSTAAQTEITEVNVTPSSIEATDLIPPTPTGVNESTSWSGEGWVLNPDWRAVELFDIGSGAIVHSSTIGETPVSLNATTVAPPDNTLSWQYNGTTWTTDAPSHIKYLQQYAYIKATSLIGSMRSYNISGKTIKADATGGSLAQLMALSIWGAANPTATENWVANDLSVTVITGAEFVAVAPLVGAYAQLIYGGQLAIIILAISAGTISTTEEIDLYPWTV